jgi:hypothetical protein
MSLCRVILHICLSEDLVAKVFAQKSRSIQIYLAPNNIAKFYLQTGKPDESYPGAGLELHQDINITVRTKVFPEYRAKKR